MQIKVPNEYKYPTIQLNKVVAAVAKDILVVEYLTVRVNYRASTTPRGLSLDAHAHNVERNLHVTIERQPNGSTSLFETLPCERLPDAAV